jgi:hypothetical protein
MAVSDFVRFVKEISSSMTMTWITCTVEADSMKRRQPFRSAAIPLLVPASSLLLVSFPFMLNHPYVYHRNLALQYIVAQILISKNDLVFLSCAQTEEEKEAMEGEKAKIRGEQTGSIQYDDNQVAMELLKQADGMDIDLENKAGIKKAATDFLELVKGKIDLPENRNPTMELGKLLMANHGKSPKEIMSAIFDKVSVFKTINVS